MQSASTLSAFAAPHERTYSAETSGEDGLTDAEEVIRKMTGRTQTQEAKQLLSGKWLTAGTNFTSVFIHSKGPLYLLDWSGSIVKGFTPETTRHSYRELEYVGATTNFKDENFINLVLTILVPHPKYRSSVDLGLIPEFAKLSPPTLKVVSSKPVELKNGMSATVYAHEDGNCSALVKLTKNSVLNVDAPSCAAEKSIIEFLNSINLERVNLKLDS